MKVAVIGNGGREAVLAWKLGQELGFENVFVLPGNANIFNSHPVAMSDFCKIKEFCLAREIKYIVPGSEQSLASGIVDYFESTDIFVLGPNAQAAQLEASKLFSKAFMERNKVATARVLDFLAIQEISESGCVLKYDGLAAGKGVFVCDNILEAQGALGQIQQEFGTKVEFLLEERLQGIEFSLIALLDGQSIKLLPPAQDHKRLLDGDLGPNTGGMGACCPLPWITPEILEQVDNTIVQPTLKGLQRENLNYKGFLYFGIMLTKNGPKLLEYNVRLGDPEAQVILPSLANSLSELIVAIKNEELSKHEICWNENYYTGVVFANRGYPYDFTQGDPINGLHNIKKDSLLFYASIEKVQEKTFSGKGRNFCLVNSGKTLLESIEKVYAECNKITSKDLQFRRDIGYLSLHNKGY